MCRPAAAFRTPRRSVGEKECFDSLLQGTRRNMLLLREVVSHSQCVQAIKTQSGHRLKVVMQWPPYGPGQLVPSIFHYFYTLFVQCLGYVVVQLFESLRYKQDGRGFDSRWGHLNFSVT